MEIFGSLVDFVFAQSCLKCGARNPFGRTCVVCKTRYTPDLVLAANLFEGVLREAIHLFKYDDATCFAEALAEPLLKLIKNLAGSGKGYIFVPAPLSQKRLSQRGYNQAELLAKLVGEKTGLEVADILGRRHVKKSQVEVADKEERRNNIKNVFSVSKDAKVPENIILIDDVITTGATVLEATKVLKRAGAKKVVVFAVAMG